MPEVQSPDIPKTMNVMETYNRLKQTIDVCIAAGIDIVEAWDLPVYFLDFPEDEEGIPGPAIICTTDGFGRPVDFHLLSRRGLIDSRLP